MTRQTNESLIAEARAYAMEGHLPPRAIILMLTRVIDRLEVVAKDSAEGQYQHAYWQQRAEEAERERDSAMASYEDYLRIRHERDALAAVVEKVRAIIAETCCGEDTMCEHDEHIWADFYGEKVSDIDIALDTAPTDVLRDRDAALIDGLADEYADSDREQTHGVTSVLMFLHMKARQRREEKA